MALGSNKLSAEPSRLEAEQTQFPQTHPIYPVLQPSATLDAVQNVNILLALESAKNGCSTPDTVLQVPNRGEDHFPGPAGYTLANTAQDAVGLLCHKGTLPTHVKLVVQQDTQNVFCRAASHTVSPKTEQLHGMTPTPVENFALAFADLHEVPLSPFLQSAQISLKQPCSTL